MRWLAACLPALCLAAATLAPAEQAAAPVPTVNQPSDAMVLADRDIHTVADRERTRYAWLHERDPKQTWERFVVASGHSNFISRRRKIAPLALILSDGTVRYGLNIPAEDYARAVLIRFNLDHYGWDAETFDKLGELDIQFHLVLFEDWPGGVYEDGKTYEAGAFKVKKVALAPWLIEPLGLPADEKKRAEEKATRKAALLDLVVQTGYATTPIVEAQNWIWQTAISFDRKAGYDKFLGFDSKASFDKLVGFDEKASLAFALPRLEAVSDSKIAAQRVRRIEVYDKIGGEYIQTKDSIKRAIGRRNPLKTVRREELIFDATETFAHLPNGLWAFGLFDSKGVLQQSAPDGVGYFHQTVSNDGKIHLGPMTCLRCHDSAPGRGGLHPFTPFFRTTYASDGPNALGSTVPKLLRGLEDEYLSPLDLSSAQRRYEAALFAATGWTPDRYARALYDSFQLFDASVDLNRAAFDLGVREEVLVEAVRKQVETYGIADNVVASFRLPPERRMKIGIDQYGEAFNQFHLALRGYPSWPNELKVKYPRRP